MSGGETEGSRRLEGNHLSYEFPQVDAQVYFERYASHTIKLF